MNRARLSAISATAILLLGAVALPVMAQRGPAPLPPAGPPNPFQGQAEAIAAGQKLYDGNCLTCHGANGGAGEIGPALVNSTGPDTFRSPARLFDAIKNGVPGTPMPPWSGKFSDDDTWRIVAYIQSLRGTAIDSPAPGDSALGEQVFWGKGQCGTCHMVRGKGGLSGPELSNIAGYRKTQSIIDALTKPYHKVYPPGGAHLMELPPRGEWRPVEVVTQEGKTVTGVLLNQDTHGLQMMGDDEKLHMFVRAKLRSVKVEQKSRMPTDYDKRLTPEEFKNLVAFLTRQANMPRPTAARSPRPRGLGPGAAPELDRLANPPQTLGVTSPSAPAHHLPAQRVAFGIALRLGAGLCMSFGWALSKWCGTRGGIPVFEMIFFRQLVAFVPLGLFIWQTTGLEVLRTARPVGHLVRALIGITGMTCSVAAVQHLPLTESAALQFTSPLFMTILAALVLHEKVGRHRWGAVALGFVGVLVMVRPEPGHMTLTGVGFAMVAALSGACVMVAIRQLSATERGATIVFYYTLAGVVIGGVGSLFHWVTPDLPTFGLLVLLGLVTGVGQQMLTESVRVAPVGSVALFDYAQLIWSAALGIMVWGDVPSVYTVVGAVVVTASGAYILHREMRLRRALAAQSGLPATS